MIPGGGPYNKDRGKGGLAMTSEVERITILENENKHTQMKLDTISTRIDNLPVVLEKIVNDGILRCPNNPHQVKPNSDDKDPPNLAGRIGWSLALFQGLWIFAKSKGWV